jgi:DNA-binding response OmpR family regulator
MKERHAALRTLTCHRHSLPSFELIGGHAMLTLVVEDDPISAFGLTEDLEFAGQPVMGPARSSGEPIALAHARQPKLALIDLNLESEGASVRVARKLSVEFDALGVLVRPFDNAEVVNVLRYLEARQRGEEPARPSISSFELFH